MFTDPTREDGVHGQDLGLDHDHVHIPVLEAVGLGLVRGRALGPNRRRNSFLHFESLAPRRGGGHLDQNPGHIAIRGVVPGPTISLPAADQDPGASKVARKDENIEAAVVVIQITAKL